MCHQYVFFHRGEAHKFDTVPLPHLSHREWIRPVCVFHRLHPSEVGARQFFYRTDERVGIYPDLDAFEKFGIPIVSLAQRDNMVAFEDPPHCEDAEPATKRARCE
jgi:hypothetical protein